MAPLQFWIRGDLADEQRRRLTTIGARSIPMAPGKATPGGEYRPAAWTIIEAPHGEPEAERNRVAELIGAQPADVTGPYTPH